MSDVLDSSQMILQALHDIRGEARKTNERLDRLTLSVGEGLDRLTSRVDATNERLDATNERLDATNERLDSLRQFTVEGLTTLNHKIDLSTAQLKAEIHELGARFDPFLGGEGAKLAHRVDVLEEDVRRLSAEVHG